MRKDYRVTVKVRNNNLLSAIEATGLSVPKFAEQYDFNYYRLNDLINMTLSPLDARTGLVRGWVDRLCDVLLVPFDALFSVEQQTALETNIAERQVPAEEMFVALAGLSELPQIEHDDGLAKAVKGVIGADGMTDRERLVLKLRFGLDGEEEHTLEQIGQIIGVGNERVRQIEAKALRKMRHPTRANTLVEFASPEAQKQHNEQAAMWRDRHGEFA